MAVGMANAKTWNDRFEKYPADRETIAKEGDRANVLAVTGAVAGGVFLATGVALLVADQMLRKKQKGPWDPAKDKGTRSKKKGKKARSAVAPFVSPTFAGGVWTTQFGF